MSAAIQCTIFGFPNKILILHSFIGIIMNSITVYVIIQNDLINILNLFKLFEQSEDAQV